MSNKAAEDTHQSTESNAKLPDLVQIEAVSEEEPQATAVESGSKRTEKDIFQLSFEHYHCYFDIAVYPSLQRAHRKFKSNSYRSSCSQNRLQQPE